MTGGSDRERVPRRPRAALRRWIGAGALALVAGCAGPATAGEPPPDLLGPALDVRSLPSLVVRWTCRCNPAAVTVGPAPGGGAVYVQGYRRFFALDAETHAVLWDHKLDDALSPVGSPLLLGDRLAVVYQESLFLLEPASGVVVAEVELEGYVGHVAGPPLTVAMSRRAEAGAPPEGELVRIDEASGQVVARRSLRVLDLAAHDGRLLAVRMLRPGQAAGGPEAAPHRLLELSSDDLSTLRTWPGADELLRPAPRLDGHLVPFERTDEGTRYRWLEDLLGGGDGPGASPAVRPRDGVYDVEAELQLSLPGASGEPVALRRLDPESGEVLWTALLPDRPGAWLWEGNRLLVHTRPTPGGRGLLLTLDAGTGEVLDAAYGLAGVRSLERWGDLRIAVAEGEVVAFEAGERGPPEAQVRPVADEVDRLLERLGERRRPYADSTTAQELEALGPEALPILLARLPALAPHAALTVTQVLSAARYEPAAPRLAELLRSFPDPPEDAPPEWRNAHPETRILAALGRLGGAGQMPAIGSVLLDPEQDSRVHEAALTALAAIGVPAVVPWIDRFYAAREAVEERGDAVDAVGPEAGEQRGEGSEGEAVPPEAAGGPPSEADRIRLAAVRHFAAFRKHHEPDPFCVEAERSLPWSDGGAGRRLLPVPPGAEVPDRCPGYTLRPEPATEEELRQYLEHHPDLGAGERLWVLTATSRHFAEAHWVVLRPVGGRWLVLRMTQWWVT